MFKNFFINGILLLLVTQYLKAAEPSSEYLVDHEGYRYMDTKSLNSNIKIDGVLNEEAWVNAKFQDKFLQREPKFGEKISEETQVAVLKDDD